MQNYWVSLFVVPALVSALAGSAQGDVLARYDFGADEATQTRNPATVNAGVTATPITSPSTGYGDTAHVQGPVWWFAESNPAGGNVLAMGWPGNAYEPAHNNTGGPAYFSFTVTPNAGNILNLTDLQFKVGTAQAGSFNPVFYVNTDVDGFGSTEWIHSDTITAQPAGGALNWQDETVSLTGLQYQGLDGITFRIYYDGDFGPEGLWDNIVLNGTVVVPEPAALSVLALGGMIVLARRRRRA